MAIESESESDPEPEQEKPASDDKHGQQEQFDGEADMAYFAAVQRPAVTSLRPLSVMKATSDDTSSTKRSWRACADVCRVQPEMPSNRLFLRKEVTNCVFSSTDKFLRSELSHTDSVPCAFLAILPVLLLSQKLFCP